MENCVAQSWDTTHRIVDVIYERKLQSKQYIFVFQILKYLEGSKVWTLASVFVHESTSKNLGS